MTDANDLDLSAQAGILLGAFTTGRSFQPNLLTRATRDQAILSGIAGASGYGWGTSAHSLLRAVSRRFGHTGLASSLVVDTAAVAVAAAAMKKLPYDEHEPGRRAFARLVAQGYGAAGAAGLAAAATRSVPGHQSAVTSGAAALLAGVGYATVRKSAPGSMDATDGRAHENITRSVAPPKAIAAAGVTTALLVVAGHGEAKLSAGLSRVAAAILGGQAADHRTAGRLASAAALAAAGWGALTLVNRKLAVAGSEADVSNLQPPTIPEVTGGPGSHISWDKQSREPGRWLHGALTPDQITAVMGEPAKQPIRVYASLASADTERERAELLLAEIDRTGALDRPIVALFSPTGSGYVNYVATDTFEYLTRGDCASIGIQYSVLPSALSLNRVHSGTRQTKMVVNGIIERLLQRPVDKRPRFVMFGESLGSQVSQEMFRGQGITGPAGIGLEAAVWIGTPNATKWRDEIWGDRSVSQVPSIGPGAAYLPRAVRDWHGLSAEQASQVRYLLLQNGDDPIPKFGPSLLWRRPAWLGPDAKRPPGSPRGTDWQPVVTFFATFLDMQNALNPTPGLFDEGGHDYHREIPAAIRQVFGLEVSDDQFARMQEALRNRDLHFAVQRDWSAAAAAPEDKRAEAEEKVEKRVGEWVGHEVSVDDVEKLAE
ncbi:MAG: alpha/beta-hydrolase family protein [Candidatus Nanopelagicales bacterium]|nr:alpha/beta-hydrolase family protein [Candidatus Nanopelagicales bacterium]MCU0296584.1 alpha/beta-hydrolase family protein [Candidatus Nanopelagicales bacterium]MCU0298300.1 alpha/beta-hydrolase family protein [Candidatus Nanopelagicales bacterium]